MTPALGHHHAVADIVGFDPALAQDARILEAALLEAARQAGLTPAHPVVVRCFEPQGATAFLLLMESHLSVHTYPEHGVIKADAYVCRPGAGETALASIARALGGRPANLQVVQR